MPESRAASARAPPAPFYGASRCHVLWAWFLDAMHAGDAPALTVGLDGLSHIVLDNIKLPSENADSIKPFIGELNKRFGTPVARVHDMGVGIIQLSIVAIGNRAVSSRDNWLGAGECDPSDPVPQPGMHTDTVFRHVNGPAPGQPGACAFPPSTLL